MRRVSTGDHSEPRVERQMAPGKGRGWCQFRRGGETSAIREGVEGRGGGIKAVRMRTVRTRDVGVVAGVPKICNQIKGTQGREQRSGEHFSDHPAAPGH